MNMGEIVGKLSENKPVVAVAGILIILVLIIGFFVLFGNSNQDKPSVVKVVVFDEANNPVWKANVKATSEFEAIEKISNKNGEAEFDLFRQGDVVKITVEGSQYIPASEEFTIDSETKEIRLVLKEKVFAEKNFNLRFVNDEGMLLDSETIEVSFKCNSFQNIKRNKTTTNGIAVFNSKENCSGASVEASAQGFQKTTRTITGNNETITLKALKKAKGEVEINVKNEEMQFLASINVTIFDEKGLEVEHGITGVGKAIFKLSEGSYEASLTDADGVYGTKTIDFSITDGETTKITAVLSKDVKELLKFSVIDSVTKKSLSSAKIVVESDSNRFILNYPGTKSISLSGWGSYKYKASSQGYAESDYESYEIESPEKGITKDIEISLKACSSSTCGKVRVTVLNEDKKPVALAKVFLVDSNTDVPLSIGVELTNDKGIAEFEQVPDINVYAFAQKSFGEGKSQIGIVDPRGILDLNVNIKFGDGKANLSAVTQNGGDIRDVEVNVFSESDELLYTVLIGEDSRKIDLKSDKRYYFVFKKEGYADYTTIIHPIPPKKTVNIQGVMYSNLSENAPNIEFTGLMKKESGADAIAVENGKEYTANFLVMVNGSGVDELGAHFRVNEGAEITALNFVPDSIEHGSSYNPPLGEDQDFSDSDTQRWFNAIWDPENSGIHEAAFDFVVNGEPAEDFIVLEYRAWLINGSGEYIRTPTDSDLGTAESTDAKQALYAKTISKAFPKTGTIECEEGFCIAYILKNESGIAFSEEPFEVEPGKEYTLEFSLNNFFGSVSDGTIGIENGTQDMKIISHKIVDASGTATENNDEYYSIPEISLGEYGFEQTVSGTLVLRPMNEGDTVIKIIIFDSEGELFSKEILFDVGIKKQMSLAVSSKTINAFLRQPLEVVALDGSKLLEGVSISEKITLADGTELFETKTTNEEGKVKFLLPELPPKTQIVISAEKKGYFANDVTLKVSKNLLFFNPEEMLILLDKGTTPGTTIDLNITNPTNGVLKIISAGSNIRYENLIDTVITDNSLSGARGVEMKSGFNFVVPIEFLIGMAAAEATGEIESKGALDFSVERGTQTWLNSVPLLVSFGLYPEIKPAECIEVGNTSWLASTVESSVSHEFTVKNNCTTQSGIPVNLPNLLAKLNWNSQKLGNVELNIFDGETLMGNEIIREGAFTGVIGGKVLENGKEYRGIASFTPRTGAQGELASFGIEFGSSTDSNPNDLEAKAIENISGNFSIIDLRSCITFNPGPQEGIVVDENETTANYEIIIGNCGTAVDVSFCGNGIDLCRGGTNEGGILVEPWTYTNLKEGDIKTVKVSRIKGGIPGFYGITVDAKPTGSENVTMVAELEVVIEPETYSSGNRQSWFTIDKYEFNLPGFGTIDSATLTNKIVTEKVDVTATLCSWENTRHGNWASNVKWWYGGPFFGVTWIISMFGNYKNGGKTCDDFEFTETLADYIINLTGKSIVNDDKEVDPISGEETAELAEVPPDAIDITVDIQGIQAKWNLEEYTINLPEDQEDTEESNGIETVGVLFENTGGVPNQASAYGIVTFKATEHIHGNESHIGNGDVFCENENFAPYNIGPSEEEGSCDAVNSMYEQKIHTRFRFADISQNIPPIRDEVYECSMGTLEGRTGAGILPKTRLNWNWTQGDSIEWNTCDASNPDAIYCDATQFTIMMMKRLKLYDNFLAANVNLVCPYTIDDLRQVITESNLETSTNAVLSEYIGGTEISVDLTGNNADVYFEFYNNTESDIDATVAILIYRNNEIVNQCEKELASTAGSYDSINCEFTLEKNGVYTARGIVVGTLEQTDRASLSYSFIHVSPGTETECLAPRTLGSGNLGITDFVAATPNINWTNEVSSEDKLRSIVVFDALLMKDAFTEDFAADFADYYENRAFFDASSFFTQDGYSNALREGRIKFRRKYVDSSELAAPGKYAISIIAALTNANRLIGANGETNGPITITFKHVDFPSEDSIFYTIPFNGMVGSDGVNFTRQGYGIDYINETTPITIDRAQTPSITGASTSESNALLKSNTYLGSDFYELNLNLEQRGKIFIVNKESNKKIDFKFFPAIVTPVIMKVSKQDSDKNYFSVVYSYRNNDGGIIDVGESSSYFTGMNACLNFDGSDLKDYFFETPDGKATEDDALDFEGKYSMNLENASLNGNVYLKTLYYTKPGQGISIKSESPNLLIYSMDNSGNIVPLSGISGMHYNDASKGSEGRILSIEDTFRLVKDQLVCVKNEGTQSTFFWNPEKIEFFEGTERSMAGFESTLIPGATCIGN